MITNLSRSLFIGLVVLSGCSSNKTTTAKDNQKYEKVMLTAEPLKEIDAKCKKICEEKCGGKCISTSELSKKCFEENPEFKIPEGTIPAFGPVLEACLDAHPEFNRKHTRRYITYIQSTLNEPPAKKHPCSYKCHEE